MGSHSSRGIDVPKETRVVFNTSVFVPAVVKLLNPAYPGYENELKAYGKLIAKPHFLIVSRDILGEYAKVIAQEPFNFSPLFIYDIKVRELFMLQKLRDADSKLEKEIEVKVKIHEDDLHLLRAAIALNAEFIVTEDGGLLEKADEVVREYRIKILDAKTYTTEHC